VQEIIEAMIAISGIKSNIDKNLRIVCLKVIRKLVELEVKNDNKIPCSEWDSSDWIGYKEEIRRQQKMLIDLGVVRLICDLISYE